METPSNTQQLQRKGENALGAGDFERALQCFNNLKKLDPENLKARELIALCFRRLGRKRESIDEYKELAREYLTQGSMIKAIALHKTVLELDPSDQEVKNELLGIFGNKVPNELAGKVASTTEKPTPTKAHTPPPSKPSKSSSSKITADDLGLGEVDDFGTIAGQSKASEVSQANDSLDQVFSEIAAEDQTLAEIAGITKKNKSPEDFFAQTPLFSNLTPNELAYFIDQLTLKEIKANDVICKEGDESNVMWIISQGQIEIQAHKPDGGIVPLAELGEGDFFGEGSFLTGEKRTASAMAVVDSEILEITRSDFDAASQVHPHIKEVLIMFYKNRLADLAMAKSDLFGPLPSFRRAELMQSIDHEAYSKGEEIIAKGANPQTYYLVQSGLVYLERDHDGQKEVLATLGVGGTFGEIWLLDPENPSLNQLFVHAQSNAQVITFDKLAFEGIMQIFPEAEAQLKATAELIAQKIK